MTERSEMEAVVEAVLFVATEPLGRDELLEVFEPEEREEASAALAAVLERWAPDSARGVLAEEVAGGIRLVTRPDLHGYLERFFQVSQKSRLSMAALETLAIVAYRQPITAPEIQELRGVQSSSVLKTLLERRLVRIRGRKQVVGKPFLYGTTKEFLLHFGLASLEDLPPLEEFEEALGAELGIDSGHGGIDHEEAILRENAALDDAEADADEVDEDGPASPAGESEQEAV